MQTMLLGKIRRPATSRLGLDAAASLVGREKARRAAGDDAAGAAIKSAASDAGHAVTSGDGICAPAPKPAGAEPCTDFISADDMRRLDDGELVDLGRLVWIAEYIAAKHAEKGTLGDVTSQLMSIIRDSAESIDVIEDDVQEMLISAQASLERIREMHVRMCGDGSYSLGSGIRSGPEADPDAAAGPAATVASAAGSDKAAAADTAVHPATAATATEEEEGPAREAASCGSLGCRAMPSLADIEIRD